MGRFLTFEDPALEAAFQGGRRHQAARQGRIAITAGAPGFLLLWALVDEPEAKAIAAGLLLAVLGWVALAWTPRFATNYDAVAVGPNILVTALSVALLLELPPVSAVIIAIVLITLTYMWMFVFLRPRWPVAVVSGAVYLVVMVAVGTVVWNDFGDGEAPPGMIDAVGGRVGGGALVFLYAGFLFALTASAAYRLERAERVDFLRRRELDAAHARSEGLLRSILPDEVAERLKDGPGRIADDLPAVSVVFADLTGFSPMASRAAPAEVVDFLDAVFTAFDVIAARHGLEKIKTIGDAYMAVAGAPAPMDDHAGAAAEMALDVLAAASGLRRPDGSPIGVRVGISSGPAVAGVIGTTKFSYDLWGDTVNIASRMESHGTPGHVQVSAATAALLADRYVLVERGTIEVKGLGALPTWYLTGRR
jgi:class 3 adenylate cyclase